MDNMELITLTAPAAAMPEATEPAYRLLSLLADMEAHPRDELCQQLGGGVRAYLQQLQGERFAHWLVHAERGFYGGMNQSFYRLDERHCSGDANDDADARIIARRKYAWRSYRQAENGMVRLEEAAANRLDAEREYRQRFGEIDPAQL